MLHWKSFAGSIVLAGLILQGCGGSSNSDAPDVQAPTPYTSTNAAAAKSSANELFTLSQTVKNVQGGSDAEIVAGFNSLKLETSASKSPSLNGGTNNSAEAYIDAILADLVANDPDVSAEEVAEFKLSTDSNELFLDVYLDQGDTVAAGPSKIFGIGTKLKKIRDKVKGKVKKGLVDVLDSNIGNKITGAVFDVVLNSEGVTVVMLDAARKSNTITEIMIDALDANWGLTKKMCPMLQTNKEFGEKFAALAEERQNMAHFFFERVDAPMYGCLTDAMLLSNNDTVHDSSVKHSTNAYMGILLDRYATRYFIKPENRTGNDTKGTFKFASLMFDTGANVDYNSTTKVFLNHGEANELTNEKFFYSLFKTPGTTSSFVTAMEQVKTVDQATVTMYMDKIFLGDGVYTGGKNPIDYAPEADTVQGYLNIVSIGTAMYDGIYGVADASGTRTGGYGFGAYTDSFIGFAKLIPNERYLAYGKAFVSAGYEYAAFHGFDVWDGILDNATTTAENLWNSYTGQTTNSTAPIAAPSRSGGQGIVDSYWLEDTTDLLWQAWSNIDLSDLFNALIDGDKSILSELRDQGNVAYNTVIDGRDNNGDLMYPTTVNNYLIAPASTVYGFHGLIELAMQEDMFKYGGYSQEAADAFVLPPFSDLTWSFAYTAATDFGSTYYTNVVDAMWLADLSDSDLVQALYPDADNAYIPSWLLAFDWLKMPAYYANTDYKATDFAFDFNAGHLDIYLVSTSSTLVEDNDLSTLVAGLKDNVTFTSVTMEDDSIITVDANGVDADGHYVYKIEIVNADDVTLVLDYLRNLSDTALEAIGIDASNVSNVDTTDIAQNN